MKFKIHIIIYKILKKLKNKIRNYFICRKALKGFYEISDRIFLKHLGLKIPKTGKIDKILKSQVTKEILKNNGFNQAFNFEDQEFVKEKFNEKAKIIDQAEKAVGHIFDLLGSGEVRVSYKLVPKGLEGYIYEMGLNEDGLAVIKEEISERISVLSESLEDRDLKKYLLNYDYEPIDWHIDFKTGFRWGKKTWYKNIRCDSPGVDIKVPWELSRLYHFLTLGQAYSLTRDEKYTREFIYQSIDWLLNNKPQFGVNWSCAMETAIRSCNWILALCYFKNSKLLSDEFYFEISKCFFSHGIHLGKNLEREFFTPATNHYLSDIAGLLYLGLFFDNSIKGKRWLDFSIGQLRLLMKKQVYDDGCDFEASTCYHRLVLELFFYPTFFLIRSFKRVAGSGEQIYEKINYPEEGKRLFGIEYMDKVYKMFEAILFLLEPSGRMPQIGDNDNGRLHIFYHHNFLDMSYLLTIGAIFFNEPKFKVDEFGFRQEALWIFGKEGLDIWGKLKGSNLNSIPGKKFDNAGWLIMRNNKNYLIASSGQNGQCGLGGHSHNDKLSFELVMNGKDIIIDPGTYLYTPIPDLRNAFRSTSFHNTVIIDGEEQNRFVVKSPFMLANDANPKILNWESSKKYDFLDAEHYGYSRFESKLIHRRKILFDRENISFFIKDIISGSGIHDIEIRFHLKDGLSFNVDKDNLSVIFNSLNDISDLKISPLISEGLSLKIDESYISNGYGEKTKSKVLIYHSIKTVPCEFLFAISFLGIMSPVEAINRKFAELSAISDKRKL